MTIGSSLEKYIHFRKGSVAKKERVFSPLLSLKLLNEISSVVCASAFLEYTSRFVDGTLNYASRRFRDIFFSPLLAQSSALLLLARSFIHFFKIGPAISLALSRDVLLFLLFFFLIF